MIFVALLTIVFSFVNFLITLFPSYHTFSGTPVTGFYDLVGLGLYFFGTAPFALVISSVVMWSAGELTWSLVEWVYRKIPGID